MRYPSVQHPIVPCGLDRVDTHGRRKAVAVQAAQLALHHQGKGIAAQAARMGSTAASMAVLHDPLIPAWAARAGMRRPCRDREHGVAMDRGIRAENFNRRASPSIYCQMIRFHSRVIVDARIGDNALMDAYRRVDPCR